MAAGGVRVPNVINAFPLTIYQDAVVVEPAARDRMVDVILAMEPQTIQQTPGSSWTGDTNGHEFLHNEEAFRPLFESFRGPIVRYLETLRLNPGKLRLYYTRSWGTVSRDREAVRPHSHAQAHLSLVYYLKKPPGSSGITFMDNDVPNQFAPNLFNESMLDSGVLTEIQHLNAQRIYLDPSEGDVLLFPSKTVHAVTPNRGGEPRISIAADLVATVGDSRGLEYVLPDLGTWRAVG